MSCMSAACPCLYTYWGFFSPTVTNTVIDTSTISFRGSTSCRYIAPINAIQIAWDLLRRPVVSTMRLESWGKCLETATCRRHDSGSASGRHVSTRKRCPIDTQWILPSAYGYFMIEDAAHSALRNVTSGPSIACYSLPSIPELSRASVSFYALVRLFC
jgi:hypothetical protein